jgi:2'-5' RNA ligase
MPYVVQLDLDRGTDEALRSLARRLEEVAGLETVREIGDVHHISLGVYDDLPVDALSAKLMDLVGGAPPIQIRLASIGIFPGAESTLFLAPVYNPALFDLHRRFHDELSASGVLGWEYYRPGAWVPHVTLAFNMTPAALPEAAAIVAAGWSATSTMLDHLRFIRFRPVETLALRRLALAPPPDPV